MNSRPKYCHPLEWSSSRKLRPSEQSNNFLNCWHGFEHLSLERVILEKNNKKNIAACEDESFDASVIIGVSDIQHNRHSGLDNHATIMRMAYIFLKRICIL